MIKLLLNTRHNQNFQIGHKSNLQDMHPEMIRIDDLEILYQKEELNFCSKNLSNDTVSSWYGGEP